MSQEKIGKFIAELRKGKKMTQQELALKLNVTDRAISNWENGRRMPDISLFKPLCSELGISINELLNGEKIRTEDIIEKYDENIVNVLKEYKVMKKIKNIIFAFLITLVCIIILSISFILISNKTFLKTTYTGVNNQEIFIPRYSFFKNESGFTVATFYSLKSEKQLQREIDNYMKDFTFIDDESTYGYTKNDLFIQRYEVEDKILFREIIIVY